jgi:hypothetical protein
MIILSFTEAEAEILATALYACSRGETISFLNEQELAFLERTVENIDEILNEYEVRRG